MQVAYLYSISLFVTPYHLGAPGRMAKDTVNANASLGLVQGYNRPSALRIVRQTGALAK